MIHIDIKVQDMQEINEMMARPMFGQDQVDEVGAALLL